MLVEREYVKMKKKHLIYIITYDNNIQQKLKKGKKNKGFMQKFIQNARNYVNKIM